MTTIVTALICAALQILFGWLCVRVGFLLGARYGRELEQDSNWNRTATIAGLCGRVGFGLGGGTEMFGIKPIAEKTVCRDGTKLSIQASQFHYSTPRQNEGPYTHVEVGYICDAQENPISPPKQWREFADGDFPNDVYGYVPTELVEQFIASHGGRTKTGPRATEELPTPRITESET